MKRGMQGERGRGEEIDGETGDRVDKEREMNWEERRGVDMEEEIKRKVRSYIAGKLIKSCGKWREK